MSSRSVLCFHYRPSSPAFGRRQPNMSQKSFPQPLVASFLLSLHLVVESKRPMPDPCGLRAKLQCLPGLPAHLRPLTSTGPTMPEPVHCKLLAHSATVSLGSMTHTYDSPLHQLGCLLANEPEKLHAGLGRGGQCEAFTTK